MELRVKLINKQHVVFGSMVLMQIVLILFWAFRKEGFHVDELWTFGLANSLYQPSLFWNGAMDGTVLRPDFFKSYLQVDPGEAFRFDSVIYNLSNDAHPPLYFLIIHAICSFFPGTISKWYGIIPNIMFFLLIQLVLYSLSRRIISNSDTALLPPLLFGFSPAAVSFSIYIRMYMLAMLAVIVCCYFQYRYLFENSRDPKILIGVFLSAFFGYMVHYYMFITMFFIALFTCLYLLIKHSYTSALIYGCVIIASVLVAFAVFPNAVESMFGNGYTSGAKSALPLEARAERVLSTALLSINDLAFGFRWIAFLYLVIVIVALFAGFRSLRRQRVDGAIVEDTKAASLHSVVLLSIVSLCFYFVSAAVSPWISSRYVCFVYPVLCLIVGWAAAALVESSSIERRFSNVTLSFVGAATMVAIAMLGIAGQSSNVLYLIAGAEDNLSAVVNECEGDTDAFFISYNYFKLTSKSIEAQNFDEVIADVPTEEGIESALGRYDDDGDIVLYTDDPNALSTFIPFLANRLGTDEYGPLPGYQVIQDETDCMAYLIKVS